MTPQAKKAAEEVFADLSDRAGLGFVGEFRDEIEPDIADIIDRAFADVLRERDELREALEKMFAIINDCEWSHPIAKKARALLSK